MRYTKNCFAAALLACFAGSAFSAADLTQAAVWKEAPTAVSADNYQSFLNDGENAKKYDYFSANLAETPALTTDLAENQIGYSFAIGGSGYSGSIVMQSNSTSHKDQPLTNKGTIWVDGNGQTGTSGASGSRFMAMAMGTTADSKIENAGFIYVDGKNTSSANSRVKGMAAIGSNAEIVNSGTIVVRNGGSAMIDATVTGSDEGATIVNKGNITVLNKGYGISYNKYADSEVSNQGSIFASGSSATGIYVSADKDSGDARTVTNSGSIVASDGAYAVKLYASNSTLAMEDGSYIEGKISAISSNFSSSGNNTLVNTGNVNLKKFSFESATAKVTLSNAPLQIEALNGNGSFFVAAQNDDRAALDITTVSENSNITVEFAGSLTDQYAANGELTADLLQISEVSSNSTVRAIERAGAVQGETVIEINADGEAQIISTSESSIGKSTRALASMQSTLWRAELSSISDRLSTIRTNNGLIGSWARVTGANRDFDAMGIDADTYTIEVGVDKGFEGTPWVVGASLAYTNGDGDFENGTSESDAYTVAGYATYLADNGSFVDLMMKTGRINADFKFRSSDVVDEGSLDQTGFIIGIEAGHRFDLPMNTFVEPLVGLTYSRLSSVSEETSARKIKLEASDSLIGRVGISAGFKCPQNRGEAYVRVAGARDFRGDIDGTFTSASNNAATVSFSDDLDDNWFEAAIGANYRITDNAVLFLDVERDFGAEIETQWKANIGGRVYF